MTARDTLLHGFMDRVEARNRSEDAFLQAVDRRVARAVTAYGVL
ncbi:MAG: hypothetical protein ACE37E_18720 [Hyphomicrobiales bacterium]